MRAAVHGLVLGCLAFSPALAQEPATPSPVTETLWGRSVTDTFRGMEALDPATLAWMEAQGGHTRAVLDSIPARAALAERIAAFTASFGVVQDYARFGGRAFFQERAPGSDNFDLVVADAAGRRTLVDVASLRAEAGGVPIAISYILPAPDGSKVAVGLSAGGSEDASIWVYDAATGARVAGPVDRAEYGATAWSADSRALYLIRLKRLAPGESDIEKYKDPTLDRWDLHGALVPLLGRTVGHGPEFAPVEAPSLQIVPGAPLAAASSINGVQNELAIWLAPAAQVDDPQVAWTPFVARSDDVSALEMRGDEIFVLSHHGAPTFQVLSLKAGQPLSSAAVLLPAEAGRVVDSIHAASDALYVLARSGAYSRLLRIPAGSTEAQEIALPFRGHVDAAFADPRAPGITLSLDGWVVAPAEFAFDPADATFRDLALAAKPAMEASDYVVSDLEATAADGVKVPLSLVQPKGAHGAQVTLVQAYGSYGISELADFSTRTAGFLREGGTYASCHVRGGGEGGDAWRVAGKDAEKPNTWRDLIACGQDLVARGVATPATLFVFGGSAGGITVGRAMTERPDLFAGVIDAVPAANTLRSEFSPNGPSNIPEFGSITTEQGFANLFEMDTLQHVAKGTQYPAVLITTGLNDPRVSPWEPAKLAATLEASGTRKPVLLRIERDGGHGIGSTRSQNDSLSADIDSFVFWRAGRAGWQPRDEAATH